MRAVDVVISDEGRRRFTAKIRGTDPFNHYVRDCGEVCGGLRGSSS